MAIASNIQVARQSSLASATTIVSDDVTAYIDHFSSAEAHAAIVAASNAGDLARANLWLCRATEAGLLVDSAFSDSRSFPTVSASHTLEEASSSCSSGVQLTGNQRTPDLDQPEPWSRLFADGVTPYQATVKALRNYGAIVQMDVGYQALVLRAEFAAAGGRDFKSIQSGDRITAYICKKNKDTQKISLSLYPRETRIISLKSVIADGLHPYEGTVSSCTSYGIFVDVGFERAVFLPAIAVNATFQKTSSAPSIGDPVTIYITRKDEKTGRISGTFQPRATPLFQWKEVIADGQTPYHGIVAGIIGEQAALVDIGCETLGWLDLNQTHQVQESKALCVGAEVEVYVVGKERNFKRIFLSLDRLAQPLLLWEHIVADGQTPYRATVNHQIEGGHFLVDIGAETLVMLPEHDPHVIRETVKAGDTITVYVTSKKLSTGRITVSTLRRDVPLERYSAIVADGTTPYSGVVTRVCGHGAFVDIGCDVLGLLPKTPANSSRISLPITSHLGAQLQKGEQIIVYVWYKHSGKLELGLNQRSSPGVGIAQLVCDGVTPIQGTLLGYGDCGAWFDINCEVLGLVSLRDGKTERSELEIFELGMTVPVYVQRRNIVTGKVSLSLTPAASPKLQVLDIKYGSVYVGTVVKVERRLAFVDFHCEVTGYLPEEVEQEHISLSDGTAARDAMALKCGDCIQVRALRYDTTSGRWQLAFDGYLEKAPAR